ncbi:MAG: DUF1648 domain-containing protein [Firmicutes bacterium]|nr:DUF1648 domain-containing protein [Bacillota bacterium]
MINENIFLFATNIFIYVLCGGMLLVLPRITRKSFLFGVKIPQEEADSPEALKLRRRYACVCLLGIIALLAICTVQFFLLPDFTLMATVYFPLLIIPLFFAAFVPNWKKATQLKAEKGWQVSNVVFAETTSSHTRGNLSALPWGWYAISLVIIVLTMAFSVARYPSLPDMIPVHFDANMQPTRYVPKTVFSVLQMPLINLAMLAIFVPVAIWIEKVKLQIDQASPRVSFVQHRTYRKRMGNAMGFLALMMVIMIGTLGAAIYYPMSPEAGAYVFWGSMALTIIPIAALLAVVITTGQGGCKVKVDLSELETENEAAAAVKSNKVIGRGDDKFWKLGMFYYNPDDPAYIVEDRFGTNLGFNYGRLPVLIGVALLGVSLVVTYVWITVAILV